MSEWSRLPWVRAILAAAATLAGFGAGTYLARQAESIGNPPSEHVVTIDAGAAYYDPESP